MARSSVWPPGQTEHWCSTSCVPNTARERVASSAVCSAPIYRSAPLWVARLMPSWVPPAAAVWAPNCCATGRSTAATAQMSVRTRAPTGTRRRPVAQRTSRAPQASHLVHSPAAIGSASQRPHAATDTSTATTRATSRTARFRLRLHAPVYCSSFESLACSSVATPMRWPTTIQLSPCTVWVAFSIHILCPANYWYLSVALVQVNYSLLPICCPTCSWSSIRHSSDLIPNISLTLSVE